MWEPKLLARLDSIKHHLMSGMATPYVIDEIECLQRDIDEEMRATSRRSDYSRYKPTIEFQGDFVEIKDIRLTGVPLDHDYFRGSSDDQEPAHDYVPGNGEILGTRKKHRPMEIDETPLQFDSGRYDLHPKVAHWICQLKIDPRATQGEKGIGGELLRPISIHSNPHPKPDCPEYVESPPPTWRRDELRKWQYPQGED